MMSECNQNFLATLLNCLEVNDTETIRNYLFDPEKEDDVAACAFESLRPIHQAMSLQRDDNFEVECLEWLFRLSTIGTPKEILLGLLELLDEQDSSRGCITLLPLLQSTLLRMPTKRASSLEWALSAVDKFIKGLPLPKEYQYEGEERKLLDFDPDVREISEVVPHYVTLIKTFVHEVSLATVNKGFIDEKVINQRDVLMRYTLSLVGSPLTFLDLDYQVGSAKSNLRQKAEDCIQNLYEIKGYLFTVYDFVTNQKDNWKNFDSNLALATVAYLAISENCSEICPSVYDSWFLLQQHLFYVNLLLVCSENLVVFKGLKLIQALLDKVFSGKLSSSCLDLAEMLRLPSNLFQVMIQCPVQELRHWALHSFKDLLRKFDLFGRAWFLIVLLRGQSHSGVQSLLLNLYKDELHLSLGGTPSPNPLLGKFLNNVLMLATKLDTSKVETDLIDNSDRLLSALNLLRYVALKGKECDLGISEFMGNLQVIFLDPLRLAINMSRAHYKKQAEIGPDQLSTVAAPQVTVGGEVLPDLPPDYQSQICNAAVTTLDLMESVLVRLEQNLSS